MTIHELFQGCRRYLIKVDRLENVEISGGDSDAGRVYPVLEFYENVSSALNSEVIKSLVSKSQCIGLWLHLSCTRVTVPPSRAQRRLRS